MTNSSYKRKDSSGGENFNQNDLVDFNDRSLSFVTNNNGELIDASDAFCQRLGCKKDEILGSTLGDAGLLTEESHKK